MPKKNYNSCYVCQMTSVKNPNLSLHRFPSNPVHRLLWLNACGLTEMDYKPSRRICSIHFTVDSFNPWCMRKTLVANAVPTLRLNRRINSNYSDSTISEISTSNFKIVGVKTINMAEFQLESIVPKTNALANLGVFKVDSTNMAVAQQESISDQKNVPFHAPLFVKYENYHTEYPIKWICRICLKCVLSEIGVINHRITCQVPENYISDDNNDDSETSDDTDDSETRDDTDDSKTVDKNVQ